jgi:cytochrome c oxidase cbb3-type subunit I/II
MWKEFTSEGVLQYPNFLETTLQIIPMHSLRAIGGTFYLLGVIIMTYNLAKTMLKGSLLANEPAEAMALVPVQAYVPTGSDTFWHRVVERRPFQLLVVSLVVILIGSIAELIPTFLVESNVPTIEAVKPYTALELEGRDLYIREGCVGCHSQLVRPFRSETERYGEFSKSGEFVYDHPFLWGSKRTGPDLHREGGRYPHSWHYYHMIDPTSMSPGSIMPAYPWLAENDLDKSKTADKINAMIKLGVPYDDYEAQNALVNMSKQGKEITDALAKEGIKTSSEKEIVALIAYLQRLGTDISKK